MALTYDNMPPDWENEGTEPTDDMKTTGFTAGYKPPAAYFNWFWTKVSKCISELQNKLSGIVNNTIKISNNGGGFAGGGGSNLTSGTGASVGYNAKTTDGFAGGSGAGSVSGASSGSGAYTENGSSTGQGAKTIDGGAAGSGAATSNGFAGGKNAKCVNTSQYPATDYRSWIDAIQLGEGTNSTPKTLQVYDYQLMDANGNVPKERLSNIKASRGAAIIIAASDASDNMKGAADYVCTGSSDHLKLTAAISALPESGGTITLSEGTFHFALNSIVNVPSNVSIVGQGASTVIERTFETGSGGSNVFVIEEGVSNVYLGDFVINYIHTSNSATGSHTRMLYIKGNGNKIENISVVGDGSIIPGKLCSVSGNYNVVNRCTFGTKNYSSYSAEPLEVGGHGNIISKCLIFGGKDFSSSDEIYIGGTGTVFINNFVDVEAADILYPDETGSLESTGEISIYADNCIISGNYFNIAGDFDPLTIRGSNVVLSDNVIQGSRGYIYCGGSNIQIENNIIKLVSSAASGSIPYAIVFGSNALYCSVKNNTCVRLVPEGMAAGTYRITTDSPASSNTGCVVSDNVYVPAVVESEESA